MDVKKNFMQAFKELTGNEEENAAAKNSAQKVGTVATEEKPAFTSAFDTLKAHYNDSATVNNFDNQPKPSFTNNNNNQPKPNFTNNNQPKPSFTNNNDNQPKPSFTNNNDNQPKPSFTNNNNNQPKPNFTNNNQPKPSVTNNNIPKANQEKPAVINDIKYYDNKVENKPIMDTPAAVNEVKPFATVEKPIIKEPINEIKPIMPIETHVEPINTTQMPEKPDEFLNTFLQSRGTDANVAQEKIRDIKATMDKATYNVEVQSETPSDITIITKGTEIIGTITTGNSIIIGGVIKGDVATSFNATITGRIEGNINCQCADLTECDIIGDITASQNVHITENTKVDGNITTQTIQIDGKIKGNITSTGVINVMKNALIIGDIVAGRLSIEEGAMVQGNVSMKIN